MSDVVTEVEEAVERIIEEHQVLWGCDDPVCAVQSSALVKCPRCTRWRSKSMGCPDKCKDVNG